MGGAISAKEGGMCVLSVHQLNPEVLKTNHVLHSIPGLSSVQHLDGRPVEDRLSRDHARTRQGFEPARERQTRGTQIGGRNERTSGLNRSYRWEELIGFRRCACLWQALGK